MSEEVIDLAAERAKREDRPDPEHITHDLAGREMFQFVLSWEHEGGSYGTQVWAYDYPDAEARVASMCASLTVEGMLYRTIPDE